MTDEGDGKIEPRTPMNAVLLSLCMAGLGHVYCGEMVVGLVWAAVGTASGLVSLWLLATHHVAVSWIPVVAVMVVAALHAWKSAKRCPVDYRLKSWNRWYVYLLLVFLCSVGSVGYALVVRDHYVESFVIASQSMSPTFKKGDRILVNKMVYRNQEVQLGDVIVFANPEKPSMTYIKRVVALSGDEVLISGGELTVNGKVVASDVGDSTPDFGPTTVPQYNCFVLGDNADNSRDSRHFGPIPLATVGGRVSMIFWPRYERLPAGTMVPHGD